jgi:hypothetical protein
MNTFTLKDEQFPVTLIEYLVKKIIVNVDNHNYF